MLHRVLVSLLLLGTFALAKSHTLTLDDLVTLALKQSPDLRINRLDVEGARARSKSARSFYLPTLDLFASGGRQYSRFIHQKRTSADLLSGTLSASQLIYDFGKTTGQIEAADEALLAQNALLYQSVADKILQIKQLYYEILKAEGLVDVQRKNVTLQDKQLQRAKRYLKAGIRTIIDLTDAKVRLEQETRSGERPFSSAASENSARTGTGNSALWRGLCSLQSQNQYTKKNAHTSSRPDLYRRS